MRPVVAVHPGLLAHIFLTRHLFEVLIQRAPLSKIGLVVARCSVFLDRIIWPKKRASWTKLAVPIIVAQSGNLLITA